MSDQNNEMVILNCIKCDGRVRVPIDASPDAVVSCHKCNERYLAGDLTSRIKVAASSRKSDESLVVQWEYMRRIMHVHLSSDEVDRVMNEMGWDGWELVGVSNHTGSLQGATMDGAMTPSKSVMGAFQNASSAGANMVITKMVIENPAMKQTVGIFKRRLTEERKQQLLAEANQ